MGETIKYTFTSWLRGEVESTKCALLVLYEQRDDLQYIEGPRLEKEYMDKIGVYEQTVIKEEIECELLQKKQQMVQMALNRREPIDEAAIDAEIEDQRQKMIQEATGPGAQQEYAELTAEQSEELQQLYRDIVKNFHPEVHSDLTEVHRQLFRKAQEAYRRKDLEALKLIHEMLYSTCEDAITLELLIELLKANQSNDKEAETRKTPKSAADYTLAGQIYGCFKATNDEAAICGEWERYRQMLDDVMKEIEEMKGQFPYTASEVLSDPVKIEAYREELAHRLHTASAEKERRTNEIRVMIESVATHE